MDEQTITVDHTPTPWDLDSAADDILIYAPWGESVKPVQAQTYGDYRGAHICTLLSQGYQAPVVTKQQALANAKRIVEAVNNYDSLRARCNALEVERDKLREAVVTYLSTDPVEDVPKWQAASSRMAELAGYNEEDCPCGTTTDAFGCPNGH